MSRPGRSTLQRLGLSALSLGIIIATFAFVLPTIADYREVWALVQDLSWEWIALLLAATLVNLLTFAPPWMVALPGLSFGQAITVTQVSTALSIVVPGGLAAGVATSYAMLRRWGFVAREVARAVTLTGLWNQFLNLAFPIIAVFLLNSEGGDTRLLGVVAFVGVAVLGVVVAALAVVLVSKRLANDIGELAAAVADWLLARIRRGPVSWGGPSFERFRQSAGDLLRRRWHVLTAAALAGSLSVFAVLVVALRAFDVPAARGIAGGGVRRLVVRPDHRDDSDHAGWDRDHRGRPDERPDRVRRQQRRRRRSSARLPVPDHRPDPARRSRLGRDVAAPYPRWRRAGSGRGPAASDHPLGMM